MPKLQQQKKSKKPQSSPPKSASPSSKKNSSLPPRDILYPEIKTAICMGENALTASKAKKLLGWQEESENIKFGNDFLFTDFEEKKIRCNNNIKNRPFYFNTICLPLVQEILTGKWQMNCENMIIGETGLTLNCQHRLAALVLAAQKYHMHEGQYMKYWDREPTLSTLIAFGCKEDDTTVNTMDTCKPRSLEDVLYRSSYYANKSTSYRKKASRILSHTVKMLWHRTGAGLDAFSPKRTHAESLDFILRHEKVLAAVNHIIEENGDDGKIKKFIPLGNAAAFLYLMGTAATERCNDDKTGYCDVSQPTEALLDFSSWDKSMSFWTNLAADNEDFEELKHAIVHEMKTGRISTKVRCALASKAWNAWYAGDDIDDVALELEFVKSEDGIDVLVECPTVGGIDLGNPQD